jgi:hypothetical protein
MATDTSREYTVHHIYTPSDTLNEIFWRTDSHEIVRLIRWQEWREDIEDPVHILL